jgi:hypothetical protein
MSTSIAIKEIAAPDYLEEVWNLLTPEVCDEVFELTRDRERQRKWGLHALLKTWIGILQCNLGSQTEAVEEYCGKSHPLFPLVEASPESFFKRIQCLRPEFFRNIFRRFVAGIETKLNNSFEKDLGISEEIFPDIYVIDASRLAKVGRVLKVAKTTTKAIIPGSLQAVYDLRRGHLRDLWFDPDGAKSEISMFERILGSIPPLSLIVADRYYAKPVIWEMAIEAGLAMVSRFNATVKKRKVKTLKRIRQGALAVDDWIVEMGGSQYGQAPVTLRWVHIRKGTLNITLLTNVLDPKLLSIDQLARLYRRRWSVERMYLHLKETLKLNHLFNASPAAVGQQAYATAILYNALRLSQMQIAEKTDRPPEDFSPDKLFPRIINKIVELTLWSCSGEHYKEKILAANPRLKGQLNVPDVGVPDDARFSLSLKGLLVEKRTERRRKRRFCKGRKTWTTYRKISGARKLLQN